LIIDFSSFKKGFLKLLSTIVSTICKRKELASSGVPNAVLSKKVWNELNKRLYKELNLVDCFLTSILFVSHSKSWILEIAFSKSVSIVFFKAFWASEKDCDKLLRVWKILLISLIESCFDFLNRFVKKVLNGLIWIGKKLESSFESNLEERILQLLSSKIKLITWEIISFKKIWKISKVLEFEGIFTSCENETRKFVNK
jgi:hypothetical protein